MGTIFGFLLFVCSPITICVVIAYCVSKRSSNTTIHTRTVTQPKVTTVATTTNTPTLQQQPYSAYTGPIYPELPTRVEYPAIDPGYPPLNAAYPYPVESGPYPVPSAPYPVQSVPYPPVQDTGLPENPLPYP